MRRRSGGGVRAPRPTKGLPRMVRRVGRPALWSAAKRVPLGYPPKR
nr:MAG TPA_asm: hypothetical protein [Caudoviricetes sp.]